MLIAHVNFIYTRGGELLSIPLYSTYGGGVVGGVIDRCINDTYHLVSHILWGKISFEDHV